MWEAVTFFSVLIFFSSVQCNDNSCLREFPISQLLRIKRSVEKLSCDTSECGVAEVRPAISSEISDAHGSPDEISRALPLTAMHLRRSHEPWDEKPSKLQTIFQLSITALSFLAFGGYLLCMIVQAIKSKGTTYYHPTANGNGNNSNGNGVNVFRKVKIYRRSRRTLSTINSTFNADQLVTPSPDELYKILINVAEGYVKLS